jgi:hypothetical protein
MMLLYFASVGWATTDTELWTSSSFRYKPIKKTRIEYTQNLRWNNNVSHLEHIMPEVAVSYKVNSWMNVEGAYRWNYEDQGDFILFHRGHLQSSFDSKYKYFGFDYRIRLQEEWQIPVDEYRRKMRHRINMEWKNESSWTPKIMCEYFWEQDDSVWESEKIRWTMGSRYKINKGHSTKFLVHYEQRTDGKENSNTLMISLNYQYKIPSKKKDTKQKNVSDTELK